MNNTENKLQAFLTSPKGLTIMVVCIAVLLSVYLLLTTIQKVNTTNTPSNNTASTQTNNTQSTNFKTNPNLINSNLYFLKDSDGKTVYINVNSGKNSISGIQLVIAYNPNLIPSISVTPGNFFDNPIVLENKVDTTNGIIYYTISIQPNSGQIYGEGTVAVLHYSGLPAGVATTIALLPQTKITAKGINDSVLKDAKSISLP